MDMNAFEDTGMDDRLKETHRDFPKSKEATFGA